MTAKRRRVRAAAALALAGVAPLCLAACGGGGSSVQSTAAPAGNGGGYSHATADALAIKGLPVKAAVSPTSGTPHTDFVVSFLAREPTGRAGQVRRSYLVTVRGPSRNGCVVSATAPSQGTQPGARVRVTLSPAQTEGRVWCPGEYRGRVAITAAFACPSSGRCHVPPHFPTRREQAGTFGFTVRG